MLARRGSPCTGQSVPPLALVQVQVQVQVQVPAKELALALALALELELAPALSAVPSSGRSAPLLVLALVRGAPPVDAPSSCRSAPGAPSWAISPGQPPAQVRKLARV